MDKPAKPEISDRRKMPRGKLWEDRRRFPRVKTELEVYYESASRSLFSTKANMNIRGIFIETSAPDPVGTEAFVRISLPEHSAMIKVAGDVVWSNTQGEEDRSAGMGVKFTKLDEESRRLIANFLLKLYGLKSFPQLEKRFADWM